MKLISSKLLIGRLVIASLVVSLGLVSPALAYCRKAGPISAGLKKLIDEFSQVAPGHSGEATVQDFLVGVSKIPPKAMAALARRAPAIITADGPGEGSVAETGATKLQFSGIFARNETYFRVPQHIEGHYRVTKNKLTLYYKHGGALELGEAIPLIGIPVFRRVNHVEITPDRLLFFWGDNAHGTPDRCYVVGED
ncbi:MAG: hypothetical protein ACP5QR_15420 [Rhizomicrobium sp.]